MISLYHSVLGATWQSKKPMYSPTAASPPVCFAIISPKVSLCRRTFKLHLGCTPAFSKCSRSSEPPSSTTMISCKISEGVLLQKLHTVLMAYSRSLAHGRTTEILPLPSPSGCDRATTELPERPASTDDLAGLRCLPPGAAATAAASAADAGDDTAPCAAAAALGGAPAEPPERSGRTPAKPPTKSSACARKTSIGPKAPPQGPPQSSRPTSRSTACPTKETRKTAASTTIKPFSSDCIEPGWASSLVSIKYMGEAAIVTAGPIQ
mmetsp:Transcript_17682/g.61949  ORF Transcript_17682/g.61949 Transcript_17682/m.61949 type:complete len:265 (-) Transcript_17682:175-969(-)